MHDKNWDPNFPIKIHHTEGRGKKWWFTPLKFNKLIPKITRCWRSYPFQTMFGIYVTFPKRNSGMNRLFTVINICFNKKHIGLLSSYHIIYIILIVWGFLSFWNIPLVCAWINFSSFISNACCYHRSANQAIRTRCGFIRVWPFLINHDTCKQPSPKKIHIKPRSLRLTFCT